MAQNFKETAHLKTDRDKYAEGWDHVFGKKDSPPVHQTDDEKAAFNGMKEAHEEAMKEIEEA
jgi:hypothetical protein